MTILRIILLVGAVTLAGAIFWAVGADDRGLGPVIQEMLGEPWSIVTLIDLYLGFFMIAALIFVVEDKRPVALFWALPVFALGNVWAAIWFAIRLPAIVHRFRRGL